jgi:hypothetical protein
MKLNKWTVGLAAVGAISLSSAVQAEETEMNVVNAMTSGTTISGYVSTSFAYNFNTATGGQNGAAPLSTSKANGFNLDVVNLTLEKPLDESEWAAGYKVEMLFGPDAAGYNPSVASGNTNGVANSDVGIKQAYVNLRAPVGNGLEFKMGVFDTIIGYEAYNYNANPNYTRSLAWSIEPTQHTGLLASYQVNDIVSVMGGFANTMNAVINQRPTAANGNLNSTKDQWNLTYMGAVAVTAPEDMGALAGSTLYGGVIYGTSSDNQTSYYVGGTVSPGVEGLSLGAAFDYVDLQNTGSSWVGGLYASFQATEKLSLHGRGEYQRLNSGNTPAAIAGSDANANAWGATLTAQYDLWQNVISRLEYRWDNNNYTDTGAFGDAQGGPTLNNAHMVALNVIYSF